MLLKLAWKNIIFRPLSSGLSVLLLASSVMIMVLALLTLNQLKNKFNDNANKVDLVIGAKGSRLQLVLCNIFHIDNPTGNINFKDVDFINSHPFIKSAVPISLGDNYKSYRIVGTNHGFIENLYPSKIEKGRFFEEPYDVLAGAKVVQKLGLKVGDSFYGSHGVDASIHQHTNAKYRIVGVLNSTGEIIDNLLLTSLETVWEAHNDDHQKGSFDLKYKDSHDHEDHHHHKNDKQITALLVNYKSTRAKFTVPGLVNQRKQLMAAEPAIEIKRLLDLIQPAIEVVVVLAWFIFGLAFFSMLITMINSLKDRKYEIAMMRVSGATSKLVLFSILLEGFLISVIGALLGLFLGHVLMAMMGQYLTIRYHYEFTGLIFNFSELWLVLGTILIGVLSSFYPAIVSYKMDISSTLKKQI
tara:strand:+ start:4013 stop:5251 length:1239 start_codon:yes stop_codon:yes gene_type:complete